MMGSTSGGAIFFPFLLEERSLSFLCSLEDCGAAVVAAASAVEAAAVSAVKVTALIGVVEVADEEDDEEDVEEVAARRGRMNPPGSIALSGAAAITERPPTLLLLLLLLLLLVTLPTFTFTWTTEPEESGRQEEKQKLFCVGIVM